jgi:hypothetical protein
MSIQRFAASLTVLVAVVLIGGCGAANTVSRPLPIASQVQRANKQAEEIDLYQTGTSPERACVIFAQIGAHGNGYATMDTLENAMKKEAAKIGAELVILTEYEVTKDETIGSYGGGMFMANQIQRPHLYGLAAVYAKARLGVVLGDSATIKYVYANSPAEKAGLKEGMQILSVNGVYVQDQTVVNKEVGLKQPGDVVVVEYLDSSKEKKKVTVTLESN